MKKLKININLSELCFLYTCVIQNEYSSSYIDLQPMILVRIYLNKITYFTLNFEYTPVYYRLYCCSDLNIIHIYLKNDLVSGIVVILRICAAVCYNAAAPHLKVTSQLLLDVTSLSTLHRNEILF